MGKTFRLSGQCNTVTSGPRLYKMAIKSPCSVIKHCLSTFINKQVIFIGKCLKPHKLTELSQNICRLQTGRKLRDLLMRHIR